MTTLLIKGVQIVDGTGRPPFKGDIFIKDKKISAIGPFGGKSADAVIDGLGAFAAPGLIDVNTESDHTLSIFLASSRITVSYPQRFRELMTRHSSLPCAIG